MDIQAQEDVLPHQAIFTVKGEIDLYSFLPFVENILAAIHDGKTRILVDCTELVYLDSSGVGGIIRLSQEARRNNVKLAFKGLSGTPLKVLSMSHILSILQTLSGDTEIQAFLRN
jgi:anti-anti-sigma factor